ncbi:methyltransferase [Fusarium mundagurra]|uniref:Methyltransferase n=1 Tax=Fusarium mundagurra TaxID=1567541 RepID=A0A8H6DEV5_9HYPO|nr:methyltransferase [Fusarium mundagurra]
MISHVNSCQDVAGIFNSYVAACSIAAAWEVGLLDQVHNNNPVNIDNFASDHDLDQRSMRGLVSALVTSGIVQYDGDNIAPGRLLEDAYAAKGLLHWLTIGSGSVFTRMQHMLHNKNRKGNYFSRDSAAIAYACRDANEQFIDPVFLQAVSSTGICFTSAVDLGSGSGARLMQVLDRFPDSTAIGVDIAGPAIELASADAEKRGYGGRVTFLEDDATKLDYRPEFAQVDLVMSFLMGHDFWLRESCIKSLRMLRDAFPKVKRFFLCDTMRILVDNPKTRYAVSEESVPIFTLGFEFGHTLMDVTLPTVEDWEDVFEPGGWRCIRQHYMMPPSLTMLFELEPLHG